MAQNNNQKLELTWIGKGEEPKLEPRILIEQPEYSYWAGKEQGKPAPWSIKKSGESFNHENQSSDNCPNMLIHGDNLLALKALEQDYAGKIKCIYIDPPYNTGNAFEHYDDGIEHSLWLSLMKNRLELLKTLLSNDGTIFVQIDDNEMAYLKVLLDEVFGRNNFINTISVNMKNIAGASGGGEDTRFKKNIEYLHIYCKNYSQISFKSAYDYIPINQVVENYREDEKSWKYTSVLIYEGDKEYLDSTVDGDGNEIKIYYRYNSIIKSINQLIREEGLSESEVYRKYSQKIFQTQMPQSSIRPRVMEKVTEIGVNHDFFSIEYIPKTGRNRGQVYEQFYKGENFRLFAWLRDVSEEIDGILYKKELQGTYWNFASETKNLSKEGKVQFPNGKKPESLLQRIIDLATDEGDIVFDSFLGSGTTAAVAHKMKRRWIGVELGQHAITHCIPRLNSVVNGSDQSGISKTLAWKGGGSFKFYTLATSLLNRDKFGNWVISAEYNAQMLAGAMAKQEGFRYNPHETIFWKQGNSSENDYIFTTTQFVTVESLDQIHDEMLPGESLLICCKAFQKECKGKYTNITIKKIPQMLLGRCEFGKEDYSLNIVNMPTDPEHDYFDLQDGQDYNDKNISVQELSDKKKKKNDEPTLFD